MIFADNTSRLRRHRAVALGTTAFGTCSFIWQAALIGKVTSNLSQGSLAGAFGGLLVSVLSLIVWQWLTQRLKNAHLTAPLHLQADDLTVGTRAQRIAFRDIESMTQPLPRSAFALLAAMIYRPALTLAALRTISLYQITLKSGARPIPLDLDVLGDTPEKIREIMDYRIRHTNS